MISFKDIHIPKPCSADYESLPGDEVKRFCGSCKNHVYDFRGKDEVYLNEIFRTTGKVCGIYYEDQIQRPALKKQSTFYYSIATKFLSIALFLKTMLSTYDIKAFVITQQTTQTPIDTSGVKIKYKEKNVRHTNHQIKVYVNDRLYQYELSERDSILYLPDSIQANDKIKIIVEGYIRKTNYSTFKTKAKEYNFIYKSHQRITIKINCSRKRRLLLFKKRTPQIMGKMRAL